MSTHSTFPDPKQMTRMSKSASIMGYEIVDLAGFLDVVEAQAQRQRRELAELSKSARAILGANEESRSALIDLSESSDATAQEIYSSAEAMRDVGEKTRGVAEWVQELGARTETVSSTLKAVKKNNSQIASISMQVNTLAINAKIEAAHAGDAGRGFAVVAEAINELSQHTKAAAAQISTNIEALSEWMAKLGVEAHEVAAMASHVLEHSSSTDQALGRMEQSVAATHDLAQRIKTRAETVGSTVAAFEPVLNGLEESATATAGGIEEAHGRIQSLIDTSETIVQASAGLSGLTADSKFIDYVQTAAATASAALSNAVETGQISLPKMFDTGYRPIPNSDPEQVLTAFTTLMDAVMPDIQEPAVQFDPKVVFCAAVDKNGYLPTHNYKFSHPQGDDPVWNMANCRNRRIFADRVGLKAGRNTEPFLLQVYRRDMGGGDFVMMKDLSAPIMIQGRHWGGLRLAYTF
jgi:methyl-accepting chemotaxis protein